MEANIKDNFLVTIAPYFLRQIRHNEYSKVIFQIGQVFMFVHLSCHTEYSLVDGLVRIDDLVAKAQKLQMPAVAITDISNLFAMVKFYKAALNKGIKPIIGSEVYLESTTEEPSKCIALCQNLAGYKSLTKLLTKSYLENQINGKPVVKKQWLVEENSGLIIILKIKENELGKALISDNKLAIEENINFWQASFADRIYLGLTRTGKSEEDQYNKSAIAYAVDHNLPVVALNDVCFLNKDDYEAHEARVCINQGLTLDMQRASNYSRQQYYKSIEEMQQLFADIPQALTNTEQIAIRCNLVLDLNVVHLPKFPVPVGSSPEIYLEQAARKGLEARLAAFKIPYDEKKYQERLDIEIKVINNMGFASYFLIVADFIGWAFNNGVPVGPGRGSGAGSLVAYALNITNLDPLQYDLLFERFLNPERVSMPDFDIDFCMEGRDRVIEYVAKQYGKDSVSQIITYGTMAARAVIRDAGRVLGHPYGFVDKIAKLIPMEIGITLDKALEMEEALNNLYKQEDDVKTLIDLARKLEGITRNVGKHAGGVVIAPSQLVNFTPLYCEPNGEHIITQFDKDDVEAIGLVKFDFLGLRTLTVIDWALAHIKRRNIKEGDANLDINTIPLNDKATFALLCDTNTSAVFQLESRGMKDLIRRLQPDCFEDIVALVALFRPGPLQSGMVDDFINRKRGRAAIEYPHPDLEPILKPTYGVILYQEQVMQIAQVLAGYTLGAADMLRRAMGKKKPEEMAQQRAIFTKGAVERGCAEKTATYIFDLMEKFAGYGFNKSHSAAYALVSYQTAWLKAHYPAEFMAAVLSADMAHTDKIVFMVEDCRNIGLKIVSPNINYSEYKFTVDAKNRIVYGLGAIKGVGEGAIESIMQVRATHGPFKDLFDFCMHVDHKKVTKRTLEALIFAGAMDGFGLHRAALMGNLESALHAANQMHKNAGLGQSDLFSDELSHQDLDILAPNEAFPQWSDQVRLNNEKLSLGLYLTGHPITQYETELAEIITHKIGHLRAGGRGEKQIIAGLLIGLRTMQTKRGDKMAFVTLEDRSGRQEVAIFADLYQEVRDLLKKDILMIVQGETKPDEYSGGLRMRALKLYDLNGARKSLAKKLKLKLNAAEGLAPDFVSRLQETLQPYVSGPCKIELHFEHKSADAIVRFGSNWQVTPSETLLEKLQSIADGKLSAIISYSD